MIDDAVIVGTQTGGDTPTGLPLSMSARVTVSHDETAVSAVTIDVDSPPILQALGKPVDAYAMAVSTIQALRAVDRDDMVTYRLQERAPAKPPSSDDEPAGHRSAARRAPAGAKVASFTVALILAVAAAVWVLTQRDDVQPAATGTTVTRPSPTPTPEPPPAPTASSKPERPPTDKKPSVVLKSDLAFGLDSARVSARARAAVVRLARQARAAGLRASILVEG